MPIENVRCVDTFINALSEVQWFSNLSAPVECSEFALSNVNSWNQALVYLNSKKTGEFLTESKNVLFNKTESKRYPEGVTKKSVIEYDLWINKMSQKVNEFMRNAIGFVPVAIDEYHVLISVTRFCLLMNIVSLQFGGSLNDSSIYGFISNLILGGHMFCGYIGDYPVGKVVVW